MCGLEEKWCGLDEGWCGRVDWVVDVWTGDIGNINYVDDSNENGGCFFNGRCESIPGGVMCAHLPALPRGTGAHTF